MWKTCSRVTIWLVLLVGCAPTPRLRDSGASSDAGVVIGMDASRDSGSRAPRDAAIPGTDGTCAWVRLETQRSTPNVILLVDQSSSMTGEFGAENRWTSLRNSIMAPSTGLVARQQGQIRFGLGIYTSRLRPETCPWLPAIVEPALHNYDAIDEAYRIHFPLGGTPTGASIDALLTELGPSLEASGEPSILVLATDGEPYLCGAGGDVEGGRREAVAAVARAHAAGIRTFLISVGVGEIAEQHMQELANVGAGLPPDGEAPFWVAGSDAGLSEALDTIVGGAVSCTLELQGRLQPELACMGEVRLNGSLLRCGEDWSALDETHLEIRGSACEQLRSGGDVALDASFPCEVILI